ncbi:FimV family protein [Salinicola halophilus]|uniref:type IV pilus assembly protein FimV n=1 Tax=Salinicola halophilus TaxID=184065 RepID=UPI000DA14CA9|nr:FimV/HubP family polar landmark protein [Salinicola halophilus]
MRHWLPLSAGVLWLAFSLPAQALGLDAPSETSALNRPLHVVLPLTDSRGLDARDVTVRVADADAYRRVGLVPSALGDTLDARIETTGSRLSIVLESHRRVREPFVDLLLIVTWPGGEWQRQVSLLFDPADYVGAPSLLGGSDAVDPGGYVSAPAMAGRSGAVDSIETGQRRTTASDGRGDAWPATLRVRPGSTLSSLADGLASHGVARRSAMLALYRTNPDAFVDGDANRLRAGVTLEVPARAEILAIDMTEALVTLAPANAPGVDRDAPRESPPSEVVALRQRLAALVDTSERQRETIDALTQERDRLLARAPSDVVPDETPSPEPAAIDAARAVATSERARDVASDDGEIASAAPRDAAAESTDEAPPAATPAIAPPAVASEGAAGEVTLMAFLSEQAPWLGAALLAPLLLVGWRQRRRRAGSDETIADTPPRSPKKPTADAEGASISQADILIAYGRHAEAREWLEQRLAKGEAPKQRLGLIRALGELRDMEAMEQAFREMPDDTPRQRRQEAQSLVDHYRARYVDESWAEATGDEAEPDGDSQESPASGLAVEDDSVPNDKGEDLERVERVDREEQLEREERVRQEWRSELEERTESDERGESDVRIERGEVAPPLATDDDAASASKGSRLDAAVRAETSDTAAREPFAAWQGASDGMANSPASATIDYVPPTLELDAASSRVEAAADNENAMPVVTFPPLSGSVLAAGTPGEVSAGSDVGTLAHREEELRRVDERLSEEREADERDADVRGASAAGDGSFDSTARSAGASTSGRRDTIPVGWEVEEVEFEPSHRDNDRS